MTGGPRGSEQATWTVTATVTHELADLDLSLRQMMRGLKSWAEAHMDEVLAHRATHVASLA